MMVAASHFPQRYHTSLAVAERPALTSRLFGALWCGDVVLLYDVAAGSVAQQQRVSVAEGHGECRMVAAFPS